MNEFPTKQEIKLGLQIVEHGVLFLFQRSNGSTGETVQVDQSWSNVHSILSRLRKGQRYCAKDHPLLIWQEGQELHIKFYLPDLKVAEECIFSSEETRRILTMLERLPGLN